MKITVEPIRDSAIRTRKKQITTEKGDSLSAMITAEHHSNPGWTKREVSICNQEGEEWTRTNENDDTEPTQDSATEQLYQARTEYQDEQ